jgi:diketogulonate reductase-like aldo/keto reductase
MINCGAPSHAHLVLKKKIRIPMVRCLSAPAAINGTDHYHLSFGTGTTWYNDGGNGLFNSELVAITKEAIKRGYRHLDTAEAHGTEEELGVGIKKSGVPRDQLFVTTKVVETMDDVPNAIETSLKILQLDYADFVSYIKPHW